MKLVSKFKDYYDGALAYGRDENVTYVRLTEEIYYVSEWNNKDPELTEAYYRYHDIPKPVVKYPNYALKPEFRPKYELGKNDKTFGYIAFCGKIYPFARLLIKNPAENPAFGEEEIWVSSFDKDFDRYTEIKPRWKETTVEFETWKDWFEASVVEFPAINLHLYSPVVASLDQGRTFIVNPCLKEMGFQKVIDPYTAFQEISMFLGGVLAMPDDKPSNQTDKEKVVSHGFDPKYGFRKPPQS